MLAVGAVLFLLASAGQARGDSTIPRVAGAVDTAATAMTVAAVTSVDVVSPIDTGLVRAPLDTPRKRPKAIEVSDWYSRRLAIHRSISYATIPVFALQYAAGDQLYKKSSEAPTWAKTMHRVGATTLAGMFGVNTVTGVWNWWDSRSAPQGRVLRTIHAVSMLGAEAAFTYAGAKLSDEAETDARKRRLHRTIAIDAMGLTIASSVMMKIWNR
jgi:hypothetical protein